MSKVFNFSFQNLIKFIDKLWHQTITPNLPVCNLIILYIKYEIIISPIKFMLQFVSKLRCLPPNKVPGLAMVMNLFNFRMRQNLLLIELTFIDILCILLLLVFLINFTY